jgi:hypothetical protein
MQEENDQIERIWIKENYKIQSNQKKLSIFEDKAVTIQNDQYLFSYKHNGEKTSWQLYDVIQDSIVANDVSLNIPTIVNYWQNGKIFSINGDNCSIINLLTDDLSNIHYTDYYFMNAAPLSENHFIALASSYSSGVIHTGFYRFDIGNKLGCPIYELDESKDSLSCYRNTLIYSGTFVRGNDYIAYVCDKQSKIYLFLKDGTFYKEINTIDKVSKPQISFFKGVYIYKRGFTHYSSIGVYEWKQNLYVLSYRTREDCAVYDKYSISSGKYIGSFRVEDFKVQNKDIESVYGFRNMILLKIKNAAMILTFLE